MHHHPHATACGAACRVEQIGVLHRRYARRLEQRVARCVPADRATIEDGCSFAWLQLLTHPAVELGPSPGRVLGWLARTATREVWRLEAKAARDVLLDHLAIENELATRDRTLASTDDVVALRSRLDLVRQVPRRPRRFLLRLALGHSYREIASDEHVSVTTTNRQIARAKRHLRALDATAGKPAL